MTELSEYDAGGTRIIEVGGAGGGWFKLAARMTAVVG